MVFFLLRISVSLLLSASTNENVTVAISERGERTTSKFAVQFNINRAHFDEMLLNENVFVNSKN